MIFQNMGKRLSGEQLNILAEKLMEWGNLIFIGLVIAQFVPGTASFQWSFFISGCIGILMAYLFGIFLMKMKGGETR